jgi:orotate phosphoribosyltransferase
MRSEERRELLAMLARESYFERQLTLSSGRASSYYVDCKRTLYIPRGGYLAGELLLELAAAAGVEQIGGMAAGALPVTDAVMAAAHRGGVNHRGRVQARPQDRRDRRYDHYRRFEPASGGCDARGGRKRNRGNRAGGTRRGRGRGVRARGIEV